ncbi:hypothetical protein BIW11_14063 [Tropilaelaps mercedesae]|uniref:Uncharacterized protein n=1 Tax=Tropilaelaps mercedesae TaxID=418985 RepID=A0A1V9WZG6_9ACAR|nr:hypothetical protein BIW11_14063 [Tropilaelaps mercedesae]
MSVSGVNRSRGDRFSVSGVNVRSECGFASFRAGLIGLNGGSKAQFVGLVLDATVAAVNLSEVVRSEDVAMRALLLAPVYISIAILDIVLKLVITVVVLMAQIR